jgi:hypothetical protein
MSKATIDEAHPRPFLESCQLSSGKHGLTIMIALGVASLKMRIGSTMIHDKVFL